MQGHPGWARWSVATCSKGAKHCHDVVSLWLGRLRYLSKLVDLGYNPMYLDTDFTAQDNFYKHLRAPAAQPHALFFMREGEVRRLRCGAVLPVPIASPLHARFVDAATPQATAPGCRSCNTLHGRFTSEDKSHFHVHHACAASDVRCGGCSGCRRSTSGSSTAARARPAAAGSGCSTRRCAASKLSWTCQAQPTTSRRCSPRACSTPRPTRTSWLGRSACSWTRRTWTTRWRRARGGWRAGGAL